MRSDSKTGSRLSFFFDNNFSKKLTAALAALCPEHHLEHLQARFRADSPDTDWIAKLASEGSWVVVSGDHDLLAVPHVVKVIRENKLVAVVMKKGFTNLELYECASKIVKAWPRIIECAQRSKPGDIWTLAVSSLRLEKYKPPKR